MRVPLSWLKDYVDIDIPVEELAHRLTLAGLEVAKMEYIGIPADDELARKWAMPPSAGHLVWARDKIVVGHILEVRSHPNADRLVLAMVESGISEVETIVTGAPNLYPYKDQGPIDPPLVSPYAREGAEVIDGHKDDGSRFKIKARDLRGIPNKSMVCSEKELGLSDEHEGIMIIESDATPGTPLQDVLGDVVFDIDLTPNLARCYSMTGIAREVAALTGATVRYPSLDVVAEGPSIEGQARIEITEPEYNPRFTAALIKGIELKPSPEWMQRRLKLAGMRPINNIVDVTNYVMLELGEPLHAFDYDALLRRTGGEPPTIITRRAHEGEWLTTLDGVDRELDPFTELVTDTAGALALAGIMGGEETEIYDVSTYLLDAQGIKMQDGAYPQHGKANARPESTTNVLLEAASWNMINLRQTLQAQRARGHEISSEAGARFSRGVHTTAARIGLLRAIEMMRQLAGGEIAQGIIDNCPLPSPVVTVDLPLSEVERILGITLSTEEVTNILTALEFKVEPLGDDTLRVTVPDHRLDIGLSPGDQHQDIGERVAQADLIEEIARIYGYDRIPNTLIEDALPPQRSNVALEREEKVRDILVRAGLQEVITYRLNTPEHEAQLTPPDMPSGWPSAPYVELTNPISQERIAMRQTLLAGILDALAANARWRDRQLLFEIGKIFLTVEGERLPDEPRRLGIVMTGPRGIPSWHGEHDATPVDYFDLKGMVETLLDGLRVTDVEITAAEHSTFYPGRTARLLIGGEDAGILGELHPLVAQGFKLPETPVLAAEFDLDVLLNSMPDMRDIRPVSRYEAVYQDIAIVVDEGIRAADVEAMIWEAGGWLLRDVRLFDVYRGEQVGAGKKSLAYALTFQADDKTLRDKDAARIQSTIVKTLEKNLGAKLRE